MTEKIILLGYIASIYPIGTRFAARLIARMRRKNVYLDHVDRTLSIIGGYGGATIWPVTLPVVIVGLTAKPSAIKLKQLLNNNIDRHVAKIEGRQEPTLGKLGQR